MTTTRLGVSVLTHRLLHRAFPLACAVGVVVLLHSLSAQLATAAAHSATLAVGMLLVGGFIGGKATAAVGLPRITGYLVTGVLVGPHVSGLLTHEMLAAGKAIEGLAVALIALTAGGELRLAWVRQHARRLAIISLTGMTTVAVTIMATLLLGDGIFPFMPADPGTAGVVAMVVATVAATGSPMVTLAVIAETRAEGPLARTALGVTVLMDVAIIVLFAVALGVAKDALGQGGDASIAATLLREVGGSIVAGVIFGVSVSLFLRFVGRDVPVFVLAACLAMWQVSTALGLETLLVALTAGFWVENFSATRGDALIKGIERVSLPLYVLFFAAAGSEVNLGVLGALWPLALSFARLVAIWSGARLGTRLARTEPQVKRYLWLGFISQAGMSLALVSIVARTFPEWGEELQALIVAMIAIHELLGPIGFTWALTRADEAGRAASAPPPGS